MVKPTNPPPPARAWDLNVYAIESGVCHVTTATYTNSYESRCGHAPVALFVLFHHRDGLDSARHKIAERGVEWNRFTQCQECFR